MSVYGYAKGRLHKQLKQDHLREGRGSDAFWQMPYQISIFFNPCWMNVAPDQTIILGLQFFLYHRSLSSIGERS